MEDETKPTDPEVVGLRPPVKLLYFQSFGSLE